MAKIRKVGSVEDGIMQILKNLSEEEILATIGKSSSYLRKCSDPQQQGMVPPLIRAHEYIVANTYEDLESHKDNDIDEMLVKSTILHGKLTEVVKQSEDLKSDLGKDISALEKKEIMEAIKNLEEKINKIKITVDKR